MGVAELHFKRFLVLSKLPKKDHKNNKTWPERIFLFLFLVSIKIHNSLKKEKTLNKKTWPERIFLFLFWVSIKIHNSLKKEKTRNKKIKLAKLKHPKKTFIFVLVLTFGF